MRVGIQGIDMQGIVMYFIFSLCFLGILYSDQERSRFESLHLITLLVYHQQFSQFDVSDVSRNFGRIFLFIYATRCLYHMNLITFISESE